MSIESLDPSEARQPPLIASTSLERLNRPLGGRHLTASSFEKLNRPGSPLAASSLETLNLRDSPTHDRRLAKPPLPSSTPPHSGSPRSFRKSPLSSPSIGGDRRSQQHTISPLAVAEKSPQTKPPPPPPLLVTPADETHKADSSQSRATISSDGIDSVFQDIGTVYV